MKMETDLVFETAVYVNGFMWLSALDAIECTFHFPIFWKITNIPPFTVAFIITKRTNPNSLLKTVWRKNPPWEAGTGCSTNMHSHRIKSFINVLRNVGCLNIFWDRLTEFTSWFSISLIILILSSHLRLLLLHYLSYSCFITDALDAFNH
jgi:hypothetical protein